MRHTEPIAATMLKPRMRLHEASRLRTPLPSKGLVLYTHTLCPYAQRVWLTLLYKDVDFDLVQVDLSRKPRWYSSINHKALVPAVTYQGSTHTESLDICRWLDAAFPQPSLTPSSISAAATMDALLASSSSIVSSGLAATAGTDSYSWGIGSRQSSAALRSFESELKAMAQALQQHGGPYLCGDTPSLADMALQPFLERFQLALAACQGHDLGTLHDGAIITWLAAMQQLPCCGVAGADRALLRAALLAHRSLDWFDYQTVGATACHPHLEQLALQQP